MRKDKVVQSPIKFDKEECLKRSEEYKKAAEIFKKGDNIQLAEACLENSELELDNAAIAEAMDLRGPIGNFTTRWVLNEEDGSITIREAGTC